MNFDPNKKYGKSKKSRGGSGRRSSRGNSSGGSQSGRSERNKKRGNDRRSDFKPLITVTCDGCHKKCEVPFKPTAGKPVYCDDCFRNNKPSNDRSSGNNTSDSKQLTEINRKLDKIMEILEIE